MVLHIPKGVDNGQQIKYSGKGGVNTMTKRKGNLYFELNIESSPVFKREENDLFTDVPVSYLDALLGGEIEVPTIDGVKVIDLEANTKNNKIVRLKNYGAFSPNNDKKRGHHYLRIKIKYPSRISQKEKEMLKKVVQETSFQPNHEFIAQLKKRNLIFDKS